MVLLPTLLAGACGDGGAQTETFPLCAEDPGPAPLRRVTRFEYGRTIPDLTGVPASMADQLPPDEETLGFDDIATAYSVSTPARRPLPGRRGGGGGDAGGELRPADGGRRLRSDGRRRGLRRQLHRRVRPARLAAAARPRTSCRRCTDLHGDRRAQRRRRHRGRRCGDVAGAAVPLSPGAGDGDDDPAARQLSSTSRTHWRRACLPADGRRAGRRRCSPPPGSGGLDTEDGLLAETDRLLQDPRATELFVHFAHAMVGARQRRDARQGPQAATGPGRTPRPARSPRRRGCSSTDAWQERPDLTTLLTAPVTFVDADLAAFYSLPAPARRGFQRVMLDPARAAGLLTQGSFLAEHAKADQTSPVLRGKFVRAKLFCRRRRRRRPTSWSCRRPSIRGCRPASASPSTPPTIAAPAATSRWIRSGSPSSTTTPPGAGATSTPACRSTPRGMLTGTDVDGPLDGVPSLAARLASSARWPSCTATQWFRYAFGRAEQIDRRPVHRSTRSPPRPGEPRRRLQEDGPRNRAHGGVPQPPTGGPP